MCPSDLKDEQKVNREIGLTELFQTCYYSLIRLQFE